MGRGKIFGLRENRSKDNSEIRVPVSSPDALSSSLRTLQQSREFLDSCSVGDISWAKTFGGIFETVLARLANPSWKPVGSFDRITFLWTEKVWSNVPSWLILKRLCKTDLGKGVRTLPLMRRAGQKWLEFSSHPEVRRTTTSPIREPMCWEGN